MEKEQLDLLSFFISIGAFFISICTAALSYHNFKRIRKRYENEAYGKLYADNNQFRKLFIDSPSFRKYFFCGAPVDSGDNDFEKASAIAEVVVNYLEHLLIHSKNTELAYVDEWKGLIYQFKKNSPIMRHMVNESKTIKVTAELKDLFNA